MATSTVKLTTSKPLPLLKYMEDVEIGDYFIFNQDLYIKTISIDDSPQGYTAINLLSGDYCDFGGDKLVSIVDVDIKYSVVNIYPEIPQDLC